VSAPKVNLTRLPRAKAAFVEPMKALLVEELPEGAQWEYEMKFDGIRAVAVKSKRQASLTSRTAKDLTARFPQVAESLRHLPPREVVLDGEIVALDPQGRPDFQLLQCYQMAGREKPPLAYYVFDVVQLEGKDLTGLPLWKRKAMAQTVIAGLSAGIRFSASLKAEPARLLREMKARGLEGLVAKQRESKYEPGRRSGVWAKFKWTNEQEFVIGGYTRPKGTRAHFGALLVGYYEGDRLLFAAKVGTGFDQKLLASLHERLEKLRRPDCPFANLPEARSGRWGAGLTAAQMKLCTWVQPKLVCQVRFAEWTRDNHLRQPAFLGLREDKKPRDVVRERPV
jgi:bifunctional non-homologous end joining protein LigD